MLRFNEIFNAQTLDDKSEINTLNDRARAAG
jgi:hypothetical protein